MSAASSSTYYNEIDPYAAEWLRRLIDAGHIASGVVDTRSIADVKPSDLIGFTQCHFFAGVGVWSHALRRAGWPDDRPVWTGSCPCQPFSSAGKGGGFADERHLWPVFHHLIRECRPDVIFGEQVASKDGLAWLDLVQADLEGTGYAVGSVDTCAAGFGAPHIRQRLYWVADANRQRQQQYAQRNSKSLGPELEAPRGNDAGGCGGFGELGDTEHSRREVGEPERKGSSAIMPSGSAGELGYPVGAGLAQRVGIGGVPGRAPGALTREAAIGAGVYADGVEYATGTGRPTSGRDAITAGGWAANDSSGAGQDRVWRVGAGDPGPTNGLWRDADWIFCRDGKWRPIEPGTFPLAHRAPARVGRLRAYGNAVNVEQARGFVDAYLDVEHLRLRGDIFA